MNASSRKYRAQNLQHGRLLKWKGRVVSVAPGALLASVSAIALSIASVQAEEISTPETDQQTFSINEDHAVTASGSIVIANAPSSAAALTVENSYSSTFVNDGTISIEIGTGNVGDVVGVVFTDDFEADARVLNRGTIAAENNPVGGSPALATGMLIDSDVAGEIENSGTITATVNGEGASSTTASAFGLSVTGDLLGSFINSGTIRVSSFADDFSFAGAVGLDFGGVSGELVNSETITVTAEFNGEIGSALAAGISVYGEVAAGATIRNSETISAIATLTFSPQIPGSSYSTGARAIGFHLQDRVAGNVVNSGTITATAEFNGAFGSVGATGISVYGEVEADATISNSGTIAAMAMATATVLPEGFGSSYNFGASAYGFSLEGDVAGNVVNSGTITATAVLDGSVIPEESSASGYGVGIAVGIYMDGELTGNLTNSGTIMATAERLESSGSANALGINIIGDVADGATFLNSGTISATASGSFGPSAYGLSIDGPSGSPVAVHGDIVNSGTINATVSSFDGSSAAAYGVFMEGLEGSFTNSGVIAVGLVAEDAVEVSYTGFSAYGVLVKDLVDDSSFANSGVITVNLDAEEVNSAAFGLHFAIFNGEITDLGTIIMSGSGDQYAVYLGDGFGTMHVDTEDNVDGLMRVNEHNISLDAVGGSRVFRFEDAATGSGDFTTLTTDPTSAWFVYGDGGESPIYVAVDSADVSISSNSVAAIGAQLVAFSDQLGGGAVGVDVSRNAMTSLDGGGLRPFASIGGQHISYDTSPTAAAMDLNIANVTVGMSGTMGNDIDVAFGFGAFNASADTAATDLDASGFYVGGSVGQSFGALYLNAGLGFGLLASDRARAVSGETASSSYDSNFVTAHVGAELAFQMSNGLNVTGYGQVRFTRQNDDGYVETGSSANLTVGDLSTDVTEFTLGIEVSKTLVNDGIFSAHATAISRDFSGDSNASVSVFGQGATIIQSSNSDFSGLNVGFGYENVVLENATLTVAINHDLGDNGSGPNLSAGMTWSF
jgi:hypothetical protein